MIFPEIPYFLPITAKAKCPKCHQPIAEWVIANKFSCPSCDVALICSNKSSAIKIASIITIFLYLLFIIPLNILKLELFGFLALALISGIAPIVIGYMAYKSIIKVYAVKDASV